MPSLEDPSINEQQALRSAATNLYQECKRVTTCNGGSRLRAQRATRAGIALPRDVGSVVAVKQAFVCP
jgi:hypothetical protein